MRHLIDIMDLSVEEIADMIAVVADGAIKHAGPADEILPALLAGDDMASACVKQEEMFK